MADSKSQSGDIDDRRSIDWHFSGHLIIRRKVTYRICSNTVLRNLLMTWRLAIVTNRISDIAWQERLEDCGPATREIVQGSPRPALG